MTMALNDNASFLERKSRSFNVNHTKRGFQKLQEMHAGGTRMIKCSLFCVSQNIPKSMRNKKQKTLEVSHNFP